MITFETLRELERAELSQRGLQRLPQNFFEDLKDYLQRKLEKSDGTLEDKRDIDNIRNTIKRLLELRERKLMDMALVSARTGVPVDGLSGTEQTVFTSIVEQINNYRSDLLGLLEQQKSVADASEKPDEAATSQDISIKNTKIEKKYRVVRDTPQFVGPDLKTYELKKDQILSDGDVPKVINDLLLKKGVIVEVK
ncbi:MAG: hypothetical protein ABIG30_02805 [Candidatus Aenigmatarchaeota archaeon]